jgi:hypothetical protein
MHLKLFVLFTITNIKTQFFLLRTTFHISFIIYSKDSQVDGHPTWHSTYMTHEKSIIQTISKFIYQFPNLNKNLNKWSCLETKAHDLTCVNNENI